MIQLKCPNYFWPGLKYFLLIRYHRWSTVYGNVPNVLRSQTRALFEGDSWQRRDINVTEATAILCYAALILYPQSIIVYQLKVQNKKKTLKPTWIIIGEAGYERAILKLVVFFKRDAPTGLSLTAISKSYFIFKFLKNNIRRKVHIRMKILDISANKKKKQKKGKHTFKTINCYQRLLLTYSFSILTDHRNKTTFRK